MGFLKFSLPAALYVGCSLTAQSPLLFSSLSGSSHERKKIQ